MFTAATVTWPAFNQSGTKANHVLLMVQTPFRVKIKMFTIGKWWKLAIVIEKKLSSLFYSNRLVVHLR